MAKVPKGEVEGVSVQRSKPSGEATLWLHRYLCSIGKVPEH
jgi:hypothetical protein